jgi:uncharacterized membrane protein
MKKHSTLPWYIHLILVGPITCVLFILLIVNGLGCSEYGMFNSEVCKKFTEFSGIDLYADTQLLYFIVGILSIITLPIAIAVYSKIITVSLLSRKNEKNLTHHSSGTPNGAP